MAENNRKGALALIAAGAVVLVAGVCVVDEAHAEEAVRRPADGARRPRPGRRTPPRPAHRRRRGR